MTEEELQVLKEKAAKYDELEEGIGKFYDKDEDNDDIDLGIIGEFAASFFGYI
jgi:hypothetical protein